MRTKLYEVVEANNKSKWYDFLMIFTIILSLIPLVFKESNRLFDIMDKATLVIFIFDYAARLITADFKLKKGKLSFLIYPFTFMAIIDLLSILPSLLILFSRSLKVLKLFRMFRAFKVLRMFKGFRYSKNIIMVLNVFKKQKASLLVVGGFACGYILAIALIMFNVEPDTFDNFFQAIWWATISLTSVGYGDIVSTTPLGKIVTMLSALFGIAIVALPSGIITAGFMEEIEEMRKKDSGNDEEI